MGLILNDRWSSQGPNKLNKLAFLHDTLQYANDMCIAS
jgi:hypothetical protein